MKLVTQADVNSVFETVWREPRGPLLRDVGTETVVSVDRLVGHLCEPSGRKL